jgi:hypothetical protein
LQDVLGEMQDCETQRAVIEADLAQRQQRNSSGGETVALKRLMEHLRQRQTKLFAEFTELWRGISSKKFRASLKYLVSRPIEPARESQDLFTRD